jgi:hypothetical protein
MNFGDRAKTIHPERRRSRILPVLGIMADIKDGNPWKVAHGLQTLKAMMTMQDVRHPWNLLQIIGYQQPFGTKLSGHSPHGSGKNSHQMPSQVILARKVGEKHFRPGTILKMGAGKKNLHEKWYDTITASMKDRRLD